MQSIVGSLVNLYYCGIYLNSLSWSSSLLFQFCEPLLALNRKGHFTMNARAAGFIVIYLLIVQHTPS